MILDFLKTFDTVPHEELLTKLESIGIKWPIHKRIKNLLTTRYMQVVVDEEESDSWPRGTSMYCYGTIIIPLAYQWHTSNKTLTGQISLQTISYLIAQLETKMITKSYKTTWMK